ncbi:hypothetical protein I4U23_024166 [Adineta vaga]|nr:hypothetical protein I4U23_024166 [Adineta vaga]
MIQTSFSFSFLLTAHHLATILSILILNNAIFLHALPTETIHNDVKLQRSKRHVNFNNNDISINQKIFIPEQDSVLEGLLGCKYDANICNQYELCFDDTLFGQCWDGNGSIKNVFTLVDGLTKNKLVALEYTIEFLNRYHLDWKDFMTQCILLQVLSNHHHHLNKYHLELFYKDCLHKDQILDSLEQRLSNRNIGFYYDESNIPIIKPKNLFINLDGLVDITPPSSMQITESSKMESTAKKQFYISKNDVVSVRKPLKLIDDESQMKPTKLSAQVNEGHAGLVETLQINNNKQALPIFNQQIKKNQTLNMTANNINHGYIIINRNFSNELEGAELLTFITQINSWPVALFTKLNTEQHTLTFHVLDNVYRINASYVIDSIRHNENLIEDQLDMHIIDAGIGNPNRSAQLSVERPNGSRLAVITLITCVLILFILASFVLFYFIKRNDKIRKKFEEITRMKNGSADDYQDLCRRRMQTTDCKSSEVQRKTSTHTRGEQDNEDSSSHSSTSSWIEEPVTSMNMDIMTGHLILSYMEDHLRDRHRLESEWQSLCTDERTDDQVSCSIALSETNQKKNRHTDCIPYDHTRVRLVNNDDGDYINASLIFDSNPKCKYIATQGPMPNTTNAFWQMVWEQGSCVIVALNRPIENGITMCHHYWPIEGSAQFNDFEVNLVSEHIWSEDYVVRSLYLRNLLTMETRTVTQFHFLTWDELCNPPSARSILDFRRKINKCFRGQSSPIVVHCNDGVGRTGTYILLDMVLKRIYKGAREINIAATLEHIRDQRAKMVKTKDQFQFVFVAVAEEVTNLLKSLQE